MSLLAHVLTNISSISETHTTRTRQIAIVEKRGGQGALGDELVAENLEAPIGQGHRAVLGRRLVRLRVLLDEAPLDGLDAGDEHGGLHDVADGEAEDKKVGELLCCFFWGRGEVSMYIARIYTEALSTIAACHNNIPRRRAAGSLQVSSAEQRGGRVAPPRRASAGRRCQK